MASNAEALDEEALTAQIQNYIASNPSPRNPQMSRESNTADRIEDQLQADGHRTWGYVIYRTTYDSDEDWAEGLRRLRLWTQDVLEDGEDILELISRTIFHDASLFDGADTMAVRGHFRQWAENAVNAEQPDRKGDSLAPRYRFCIQIDAESLRSILNEPPPPDRDRENPGWVKLIEKKWAPIAERAKVHPGFAKFRESPAWNDYEPLEGITEKDVGWVSCPVRWVMTQNYVDFMDRNGYAVSYSRPPEIVGWPWI